jgi:hypothetical protein
VNLDTTTTVMLIGGSVLMYSAVKNIWPQYVVMKALGRKVEDKPEIHIYHGKVSSITPIFPSGGGKPPSFTDQPSTGSGAFAGLNITPLYLPRV